MGGLFNSKAGIHRPGPCILKKFIRKIASAMKRQIPDFFKLAYRSISDRVIMSHKHARKHSVIYQSYPLGFPS